VSVCVCVCLCVSVCVCVCVYERVVQLCLYVHWLGRLLIASSQRVPAACYMLRSQKRWRTTDGDANDVPEPEAERN
jgi:hypothetical protein